MQADQDGIGAKRERVVKQIAPAGEIEHRMLIDRLLQGSRVIGMAVAFDAEGVNVDPGGAVRQRADRRRCRGRQSGEG